MAGVLVGLSFCAASRAADQPPPAKAPLSASPPAGAENADIIKAGERAFRLHCRSCHAVGNKAVSRKGPTLNGVTGQKAAQAQDFKFSDALQKSGLVWTEKNFVDYNMNPQRMLAGTSKKMPVIKDEKILKDIYLYLQQF
ncbi:MAG: c-type cytochrome [Candidatus Accumulibacter sp.]|nr:c-type cytochrome [Accumulibacter sp.]